MQSLLQPTRWLIVVALFCQITGCGGGDDTSTAATDGASTDAASSTDTQTTPAGGENMDSSSEMGYDPEMGGGSYEDGNSGDDDGMVDYDSEYGSGDGSGDSDGYDGMSEEMMSGGYGGDEYGGEYANGGANGVAANGRPASVGEWTNEDILAAIDESDARVLQAIEAKAGNSAADPNFVPLMQQVLAKAGNGAASPFGMQGFPGGGGAPPVMAPPERRQGEPPGGASVAPDLRRRMLHPPRLDRFESMIGESLLTFVPQAAQGTRNAAANVQNSANGGYSQAMSSEMQGGSAGYDPEGMNSSGYPEGYGDSSYESGSQYGTQSNVPATLDGRSLVETVVRALVRNNTPQAWGLIEQIATGKVTTALSTDSNTEIILKEVFSSPTPNVAKAQGLLSAALTSALAAPAENSETLRLIAALAKRPADHYLSLGSAPPPLPPPVQPGQMQSGQMQSGQMQSGMGMQMNSSANGIQQGAVGYPSAAAMNSSEYGSEYDSGYDDSSMQGYGNDPAQGSGGIADFGPPPPPEIPLAETTLAPVARILWAPTTASRVASLLESETSASSATDLLALASVIPSEDVRRATFKLLSQSYSEGATGLSSSALFRHFARDPGMLTVLKALPRKRPAEGNTAPGPEATWATATQEVLLSLRDRLAKVSDDPALAFTGVLPIRLHKDAVAERTIRIQIPASSATELGDATAAKTSIYYSRVRVVPQRLNDMQAIVDHYHRRTKGYKREDRAKGILWYDGVRAESTGGLQTMDVIVQQLNGQQGRSGGANGPNGPGGDYESGYDNGGGFGGQQGAVQFTVEVIIVSTQNPGKPPADATDATASL